MIINKYVNNSPLLNGYFVLSCFTFYSLRWNSIGRMRDVRSKENCFFLGGHGNIKEV